MRLLNTLMLVVSDYFGQDFYQLLGLARDATTGQIERACCAAVVSPERKGASASNLIEKIQFWHGRQRVAEARLVLSNPKRREHYDEVLRRIEKMRRASPLLL